MLINLSEDDIYSAIIYGVKPSHTKEFILGPPSESRTNKW